MWCRTAIEQTLVVENASFKNLLLFKKASDNERIALLKENIFNECTYHNWFPQLL